MNVACLISGGKDSLYACYIAKNFSWDVKYLISIKPKRLSWMYHRENVHLLPIISRLTGIKLLIKESEAEKEEELEDLKELIDRAGVEAIVSGAVASEYQRTRIEKICHELGVKSFTPLWHKKHEMLLREMLDANFEIIIVAVAAQGMDERWLGRKIDDKCLEDLKKMENRYGINFGGEGGEYETFVLNCPLYSGRIKVVKGEKKWDGGRGSYEIKKVVIGGQIR